MKKTRTGNNTPCFIIWYHARLVINEKGGKLFFAWWVSSWMAAAAASEWVSVWLDKKSWKTIGVAQCGGGCGGTRHPARPRLATFSHSAQAALHALGRNLMFILVTFIERLERLLLLTPFENAKKITGKNTLKMLLNDANMIGEH